MGGGYKDVLGPTVVDGVWTVGDLESFNRGLGSSIAEGLKGLGMDWVSKLQALVMGVG